MPEARAEVVVMETLPLADAVSEGEAVVVGLVVSEAEALVVEVVDVVVVDEPGSAGEVTSFSDETQRTSPGSVEQVSSRQ